ncbi:MAG TPA: hypothetical protein VIR82_24790 [Bradyrhizobium sp.]
MNPSDSRRAPDIMQRIRLRLESRLGLLVLIGVGVVISCYSLVHVALYQPYLLYDADRLAYALVAVTAFSIVSLLFVFVPFSFGYFIGFNLFSMVLGFIWLNCFSKLNYDHRLAGLSAAVSALLFLLPALLINAPAKPAFALTPRGFQHLLNLILLLALGTIVAASFYNFRLVSISRIYDFRNQLHFPVPIGHLIGIVSTALLPFAFASYLALSRRWLAGLTLLLMLLFYPITLSKFAFFSTGWMIAVLILSRAFEPRAAVILSVILPILAGAILIVALPHRYSLPYFDLVNIRMMATPSIALEVYNDFFAGHAKTWFCQISFLKPLMNCPYQEPLSVVMEKAYKLGNFNASLFATEGVASVGLYFAPLAALLCGLIVAIGNRTSARLPARFVLISSALLPSTFLNVPFATALLTHGAAFLFLLWYVTPRAMFEPDVEPAPSSDLT